MACPLVFIFVFIQVGHHPSGIMSSALPRSINPFQNLSSSNSSRSSLGKTQEYILKAMMACHWGLVASVSLEEDKFVAESKNILDIIHSHEFPIIHYKMANTPAAYRRLRDIIWNSYSQQFLTDFIILASCPGCVLRTAQEAFEKEKRGVGALMVNRMRFIILTWNTFNGQMPAVFKKEIFDNIVLVVVNKDFVIDNVYTLMWRGKSKREFEKISYLDMHSKPGHTEECKLFPNLNYGLNGRTLVVLAKEWRTYLHRVADQVPGKLTYSGFSAAIIDTLAKNLNFTYVYFPEPGQDDLLTWSDYVMLVQNRQADFGADLYLSNVMTYSNITVTSPVVSGDIRGVFKHPGAKHSSHFKILSESGLYWKFTLALFSTMTFYMLIITGYAGMGMNVFSDCYDSTMSTDCLSRNFYCENQFQQKDLAALRKFEARKADYRKVPQVLDKRKLKHKSSFKIIRTGQSSRAKGKRPKMRNNLRTEEGGAGKIANDMHMTSISIPETDKKTSGQFLNAGKRGQTKYEILNSPTNNFEHSEQCAEIRGISTMAFDQTCLIQTDQMCRAKELTKTNSTNDLYVDAVRRTPPFSYENSISNKSCHKLDINRLMSKCKYKDSILDIIFSFVGSVCGQGRLPAPPILSIRLLVCSWCLTITVVVAVINGSLTADFVRNIDALPFRTFEDLQAQSEYKWGMYNESTALTVLELAKPGTLFRNLYDGMQRFVKTDPGVIGSWEDIHQKLLSEKFVVIMDSFTQNYLENVENITDLVVLSDILMTINVGYIFPKHSEVADLFSKQISKLVEFGVIEDILRKSCKKTATSSDRGQRRKETPLNLSSMRLVGLVCGFGAIFSFLILLLELCTAKTNAISHVRKVVHCFVAFVEALFQE